MAIRGKIRLYKNGVLQKERMYWGRSQRDNLIASWRALRTDSATWEIGIEPQIKEEKAKAHPKQVGNRAKKVVEIDRMGNVLGEYPSAEKCGKELNLCNISRVCRGDQSDTKGRYFKYA